MSKAIISAAKACEDAILTINENADVINISRIFPNTRGWYVHSHAKLDATDYVIAYMWHFENKPSIIRFNTFGEYSKYIMDMCEVEN